MKIKIDRDYTTKKQESFVKTAIEDFKERFTEEDLNRMFCESFGLDTYGEILKSEVSAFASNYHTQNTSFRVEMIVMCSVMFVKYSFFIDEEKGNYVVDDDIFLRTYETYVYQS